jgi:hypothetical protein
MINAFAGRKAAPSVAELKTVLKDSFGLWHELIEDLKSDLDLDGQEWNKSSTKSGWALRLQLKKRNIVYLSPGNGIFLASFALGGMAMEEVQRSNLPADVMNNIANAKRYAEGTAVRIEVRNKEDAGLVRQLAKIKSAN